MKKLLMSVLTIIMMLSMSFAQDISIILNGEKLKSDVAPTEIQGRVMVPVRVISEKLGATVDFNFDTNEITITRNNDVVKLTLESKNAYINSTLKILDVPAKEINNRTLVPIRFVGEALGADVAWDEVNNTVKITSNFYNINRDEKEENYNKVQNEIQEKYDVKIKAIGKRADVIGEGKYCAGEDVEITLVSKKGYRFELILTSTLNITKIKVKDELNKTTLKFNMPEENVEMSVAFSQTECSEGYYHNKITGYIDGKNGVYHNESIYCTQCNEVFKVVSILEHNFINGKCICGANEDDKYFWSTKFSANYDASILELLNTQLNTFSNCMIVKGKFDDINVVILAEFFEDELMWLTIEPCWDELERNYENYYGQDYVFDIISEFRTEDASYWFAPSGTTEPGRVGNVLGVTVRIEDDSDAKRLNKLEIKNEFLLRGFEVVSEIK